jgi:hypothetical protein
LRPPPSGIVIGDDAADAGGAVVGDAQEVRQMTVFATTRVAILDPITGQTVAACRGPRPDGRCSAPCREAIACADRQLLAEVAGEHLRFRVFVPADLERCPLAPPPRIPLRERRDPEVRSRRDALARWFGLHPVSLAALDEPTLQRMLARVGGMAGPAPWEASSTNGRAWPS